MIGAGLSNLFETTVEGKYWDAPTTVAKNKLGTRIKTKDGREFRYCLATNATIDVGELVGAVPDEFPIAATYFGATTVAAPISGEGGDIGDTKLRVCVLTGVATMLAGEYTDGTLVIQDGTGVGQSIPIVHNEANAAAGTNLLYLAHPLTVALSNSSVGRLYKNRYRDCLACPVQTDGTAPTDAALGIACHKVTAASGDYYFWVQNKGPVAAQADATITEGDSLTMGFTTEGRVDPIINTNVAQIIGYALADITNTKHGLIYIDL